MAEEEGGEEESLTDNAQKIDLSQLLEDQVDAVGKCEEVCELGLGESSKEFRILLSTTSVPQAALDLLLEKCYIYYLPNNFDRRTLIRYAQGMDGFLVHSDYLELDAEFIKLTGLTLKVISLLSHDWIQVDMGEARKNNIKVGTTNICSSPSAAEVAVGLGITVARRVKEAQICLQKGETDINAPLWMAGYDYKDSVIGILGLGRLGSAIASRLAPFYPKDIIYYSRRLSPKEKTLGARRVSFNELISSSDFIFVCIPFSEKNKDMFNETVFRQMKRRVIIVCMSRLSILNVNELYCALKKGYIYGAGMDVSRLELPSRRHPIYTLKNCVILPGVAGKGAITRIFAWMTAVKNLLAGMANEEMPSPVILEEEKPDVETEEEKNMRLMIEEQEKRKKEEEQARNEVKELKASEFEEEAKEEDAEEEEIEIGWAEEVSLDEVREPHRTLESEDVFEEQKERYKRKSALEEEEAANRAKSMRLGTNEEDGLNAEKRVEE